MPHTFGGKKVRDPVARRRKIRRIVAVVAVVVLIAGAGSYIYISNLGGTQVSGCATTAGTTVLGATGVYAKIDTSLGCIEVQLFPSAAPKTVANFVNLSNSGFYKNLVWHRIEPTFVIQTGDPTTRNGGGNRSTWGSKGSNQTVPLEIDKSLHNLAGYLGMARGADNNSGSSQFYINLANNSASLDGRYTVFGKVIGGMDVVQAIGSVQVEQVGGQHEPVTPVYVIGTTIQDTP